MSLQRHGWAESETEMAGEVLGETQVAPLIAIQRRAPHEQPEPAHREGGHRGHHRDAPRAEPCQKGVNPAGSVRRSLGLNGVDGVGLRMGRVANTRLLRRASGVEASLDDYAGRTRAAPVIFSPAPKVSGSSRSRGAIVAVTEGSPARSVPGLEDVIMVDR